ncbi:MAG TPA: ATP-binding protein [Tepidisphaeraceae bacterium]|jgi:light-regulated signal transduction histidine kinase (bacteriophytochrome)
MIRSDVASPSDIATCDREAIHIPGRIQPHGFLLAVDEPAFVVRQVSRNVRDFLATDSELVLGRSLADVLGEALAAEVRRTVDNPALNVGAVYLQTAHLSASGRPAFSVIGHRRDGLLVLEFEPAGPDDGASFRGLHTLIETFVAGLENVTTVAHLCELAARETRRITGFDRVLVYQFDADWNGLVIAEDRNERLPLYLDLRFPASDIPRQARELYRLNRLRIIPDSGYTPSPLVPSANPLTGRPLDLSLSVLRSVSPVHVEYMNNMGTAASMSISIIRDGQLWGLISCHHKTPRLIPFEARMACDFIGKVLSLQLTAKEQSQSAEYRVRLKTTLATLLTSLAREESLVEGLRKDPEALLGLTAAQGAAVVHDGGCLLLGSTPDEAAVRKLADWFAASIRDDVFSTDCLADYLPEVDTYRPFASGVIAASISRLNKGYILWFRPEVVQTVKWGGDPRKPTEPMQEGLRLHPRKSFDQWKETVHGRSLPWQDAEIETAAEFRNVILGIVLQKAEELAGLTRELERSNKELEAFSYSVSHDLRAPFRHIVGYAELLREQKSDELDAEGNRYINTIIDSANYAGKLVDNLLAFSQMGRSSLSFGPIDMDRLMAEVRADVMSEVPNRNIVWNIRPLPPVVGDLMMLKLAVRNLLANAVKYTGHAEHATIDIGFEDRAQEIIFCIQDDGIGFDMQYVDKLFGVFQRLHRMEEFEGTGIGLANVRRIINRHGGQTWAHGKIGQGATFYFSLPKRSQTQIGA